jgi:hypothetical protein
MKFVKPTSSPHDRALSLNGLKPATGRVSKKPTKNPNTIRSTNPNPLLPNHHKLELWPIPISELNRIIPKFNSNSSATQLLV